MLEAHDLSFSYDGHVQVLESLEFTLCPGEIVGILGPTGSGKSTLAKILSGFIPHAISGLISGMVAVDDMEVIDIPIPEMARYVALVQQDPEGQICTLQVADEVAFGPENYLVTPNELPETVWNSLESVGAIHLENRQTYALSGGEKQRIAIAAMLACHPRYLILDEPSSSLDPTGVIQLRKVLLALKEDNIGVLCIEHRLPTVFPIADRILELRNGRLSEWKAEPATHQKNAPSKPTITDVDQPIIAANGLSFSYGNQIAIRNLTFAAYPGDVIAVIGNNGSGKTTLLTLLGGLQRPNAGEVRIESKPVLNLSSQELAKRVAMVFQNPNYQIFERTVWKEQILTLEVLEMINEDSLEKAVQILESAHLENLRERNPFSLSHGQKRRLNVTSVVNHEPQIYLFDEPLIGQDISGRQLMAEIIRKRAEKGGISMITTHDSGFALQNCNRMLFMDNGSILLDGSPASVIQRLEEMGKPEYSEQELRI